MFVNKGFTMINLIPGKIGRLISIERNTSPLFLDESGSQSFEFSSDSRRETVKNIFEKIAKNGLDSHLPKEWGKSDQQNKFRPAFYNAISRAINVDKNEIKRRIKEYVDENSMIVLDIAREISKTTGSNIENIESRSLLELISKSSESISEALISFILNEEPKIRHRKFANFVLAEVVSKIFNINISIRDFNIYFNNVIGGAFIETWRIEAKTHKNDAPTLNFLCATAHLTSGAVLNDPSIVDIPPQELLEGS